MPAKPKKKKSEDKLPESSHRQVVQVVEEEQLPEAIETIKKDTQEIEEVKEVDHRSVVESLFAKEQASAIAPEITIETPKSKSFAVWAGLMLGIVSAIGVGLLFFVKGPDSFSALLPKSQPTITPTLLPSPTVVAINRSDSKIRVVNGGGTPGAATKMKTFLEDLGYTVVSVGNSDEYTFTDTQINVKSGMDALATLLEADLKLDYSLGTTSADVSLDQDYDALVTVGK